MEVWKAITDLSGYEISSCGRVRNSTGRILKTALAGKKRNSVCVGIRKDGLMKSWKIHRLVATAFLPNPENFPDIDHIDRNPENNNLENLRWVPRWVNMQNTGTPISNTSGHKNIKWDDDRKKWRLYKMINGKLISRRFDTLGQAIAARDALVLI